MDAFPLSETQCCVRRAFAKLVGCGDVDNGSFEHIMSELSQHLQEAFPHTSTDGYPAILHAVGTLQRVGSLCVQQDSLPPTVAQLMQVTQALDLSTIQVCYQTLTRSSLCVMCL